MNLSKDQLLTMYRTMVTIREFEETTVDVYRKGQMPGLAHPYSGQEAVAVGVCSTLREDDYITSTHRGHGHCIAKGADVIHMMAEIMGKETGYCRGKGGSMHIASMDKGILGANGIVGGGMGIAAGAAMQSWLRQSGQVVVCFFGDGAANQGVMLETMNMAALWKLPLIYVCENNGFGQYSRVETVTAGEIWRRAEPFGVPSSAVDGMDVLAVYEAMLPAVERARQGEGPTFFEMCTYRYWGHHTAEVKSDYRTEEEVAEWRKKDPINLFHTKLITNGWATQGELDAIDAEVRARIAAAREMALAAPYPEADTALEDVYAG